MGAMNDKTLREIVEQVYRERGVPPDEVAITLHVELLKRSALSRYDNASWLVSGEHYRRWLDRIISFQSVAQTPLEEPSATEDTAPRIASAPGHHLLQLGEFLFSRKVYQETIEPAVMDMRLEYFDALAAGRQWKARLIWICGTWGC
jgi:hypothetical protein